MTKEQYVFLARTRQIVKWGGAITILSPNSSEQRGSRTERRASGRTSSSSFSFYVYDLPRMKKRTRSQLCE